MITKVIMPQMSLTMQVGIVSKWHKKVGESVVVGEPICTVEGDKAAVDIEAPSSGILKKIVAQEGSEFPVKQVMAYIGDPKDKIEVSSTEEEKNQGKTNQNSGSNIPKLDKLKSDNRIKASPIAKRLAKEKGIDLAQVSGSGPDGLIGKEDILAFSGKNPALKTGDDFREFNTIEKIIAGKMAQSNQEIPHFHLSTSCNLEKINSLRKGENNKNGDNPHITLTDIFIWTISRSLKKYPEMNSSFQPNRIVFHSKINVGLAVDTPNGLLVVVIKTADEKSIVEIAETREELTRKALAGTHTPDDLADATFTISNLGMFGIESFDPIITPGQVGILGIGALTNSLALDDKGTINSFEQLTLTLGCDHRVIDGVSGAKFLSFTKEMLEKPADIFNS